MILVVCCGSGTLPQKMEKIQTFLFFSIRLSFFLEKCHIFHRHQFIFNFLYFQSPLKICIVEKESTALHLQKQ